MRLAYINNSLFLFYNNINPVPSEDANVPTISDGDSQRLECNADNNLCSLQVAYRLKYSLKQRSN